MHATTNGPQLGGTSPADISKSVVGWSPLAEYRHISKSITRFSDILSVGGTRLTDAKFDDLDRRDKRNLGLLRRKLYSPAYAAYQPNIMARAVQPKSSMAALDMQWFQNSVTIGVKTVSYLMYFLAFFIKSRPKIMG